MIINFGAGLGDEVALTAVIRRWRQLYPRDIIRLEGLKNPDIFLYNPNLLTTEEMSDSGIVFKLRVHIDDNAGNLAHAFAKQIGIRLIDSTPEIFLDQDEVITARKQLPAGPVVAIDPWAMWPSRRWPHQNYEKLVGILKHNGYSTVQVGRSRPDFYGNTLKGRLPVDVQLCDKQTLRESIATISCCEAIVCNDSGSFHLAAAVGVPQVVFFSVKRWYMRSYWNTVAAYEYSPCDRKCAESCSRAPDHFCLSKISPEEAYEYTTYAMYGDVCKQE